MILAGTIFRIIAINNLNIFEVVEVVDVQHYSPTNGWSERRLQQDATAY
jgi:hypothetical protein